MQRPSIKPGPRWFCKQRRQVHCSAMRPRQSRWLIRPEICLLLSGWTVFGRQARIRNREGTNGRAARTTDGGHRGQHQPGSNGVRHRQHRGAARWHADTCSGRNRGRGRHSWLEQGDGRGYRQHRGGSAGFLAGDSRAALRELPLVLAMGAEAIVTRPIQRPGRDATTLGRASGELRRSPRSSIWSPRPQCELHCQH